jgi:dipicolinate synthase subunit A
MNLLFSTVPTRVVGADVLSQLHRSALVVDLAAPPGGVDFNAAKQLGLKAIWARGLGSRAPVTVGASQWTGIRERIKRILSEES